MLRPTKPSDTPVLIDLAEQTRAFKPIEMQALREVLDDYHATMWRQGHRCTTDVEGERIVGFVYFAPAAMTDRTWYLYWIAVRDALRGQGRGSSLLAHCEDEVRRAAGRLLLIETSSLPHYERTRSFYLKHGYEAAAVIRDYYADGDDMVVFRKRLPPS
jgi:ribosomal protein S18 acetylase RimI-like enzyme